MKVPESERQALIKALEIGKEWGYGNVISHPDVVTDMNGTELKRGARVVVHQDEGDSLATVHDVFPDSPTARKRGHWVDIEKDAREGLEETMSYILEVTTEA